MLIAPLRPLPLPGAQYILPVLALIGVADAFTRLRTSDTRIAASFRVIPPAPRLCAWLRGGARPPGPNWQSGGL
jgi:hypothetical protein